jgi:hypothetical protein
MSTKYQLFHSWGRNVEFSVFFDKQEDLKSHNEDELIDKLKQKTDQLEPEYEETPIKSLVIKDFIVLKEIHLNFICFIHGADVYNYVSFIPINEFDNKYLEYDLIQSYSSLIHNIYVLTPLTQSEDEKQDSQINEKLYENKMNEIESGLEFQDNEIFKIIDITIENIEITFIYEKRTFSSSHFDKFHFIK